MSTPTRRVRVIETVHGKAWPTSVEVPWVCSKCGGPRGEPKEATRQLWTMDHRRRTLTVDDWSNPCGHHESSRDVLDQHAAFAAEEGS